MTALPRKNMWQIVLTIILVGINLRPFLTGPGPVIDNIIASTGMSYSQVSLLTLLPMILMGVGALVVPFYNLIFKLVEATSCDAYLIISIVFSCLCF